MNHDTTTTSTADTMAAQDTTARSPVYTHLPDDFDTQFPGATVEEIDRYLRFGELPYRGGDSRVVFVCYRENGIRMFSLRKPDGVTPFFTACKAE